MSAPRKLPSEDEIEAYLEADLRLRKANGEAQLQALDANYRLGLALRDAIEFEYPHPPPPPAKHRELRIILQAGIVLCVAALVGWVAYQYPTIAPYLAIGAIFIVYGYQQIRIEDLKSELGVVKKSLSERLAEIEAVVHASARQLIMEDFEDWRSAQRPAGWRPPPGN